MDNDTATATKIAALEAEVARLNSEVSAIGTRLSMEQEDHAATREKYGDALVEETKLTTKMEALRNELDEYRLRLAGALIASEGGDGQPQDALQCIKDCPTIASVMELRKKYDSLLASVQAACTGSGCLNAHELRVALDAARADAKLLADEVRAWRAFDEKSEERSWYDAWMDCEKQMNDLMDATDASGALERNR